MSIIYLSFQINSILEALHLLMVFNRNHLTSGHVPHIGQRRNLKSRLFKELNQPIDYTPKYTFKR